MSRFLSGRVAPARRWAASAAVAALMAGCAPNLGASPVLLTPDKLASDQSLKAPTSPWPSEDWWRAYGDPQLDALMDEALAGAPDLAAAAARVRQASAAAEAAGAGQKPQLQAKSSIDDAAIAQSIGLPRAVAGYIPSGFGLLTNSSLSLSYMLDVFGKNRALLRDARDRAAAAEADRAAARLELTTALASAYADFIRLSRNREAALEAVKIRQATLNLVSERRANGLETRGELSQQGSALSLSRADVDGLDAQIAAARDQIAALLGKGPDRGLSLAAPTGASPALRPDGLPDHVAADLIGRRPDLVSARLRAEAARQRVKAAAADFYPNVDLTASALAISVNNQSPFDHRISLTQFGPALSLPLFSGGRLEGALRGARGEYDEAVALYNKTLARALADVSDALARKRADAARLMNAKAALAAQEDAYQIARLRYQGGLSPYIAVLTVESALIAQRQTVINAALQSFVDDVALVRALGGGYRPAAGAPAATL